MRGIPALAIVLAFTLAGCSGGGAGADGAGSDSPDTGSIRGVVVDSAIVPVIGARIILSGIGNTSTDDQGEFRFTGLAPGDYFLSFSKAGYLPIQTAATVTAGDNDPAPVRIQVERLTSAEPYLFTFKLDGYYECTYALFFVTDSCDWVYRTGWDVVNETYGRPPVAPRSIQKFHNTQFFDVNTEAWAIVQEGFWSDTNVETMMISVDHTPIDAGCDCSASYLNVVMASPTLGRMDRFDATGKENKGFPDNEHVAARGFIPFAEEPVIGSTDPNAFFPRALNFQFTVLTTLFYNYIPPEGWTYETQDQFPVG